MDRRTIWTGGNEDGELHVSSLEMVEAEVMETESGQQPDIQPTIATSTIVPGIFSKDAQPSVFAVSDFKFPYHYRFPGQDSEERVLFITRESKAVLYLRLIGLVIVAIVIVLIAWGLSQWVSLLPMKHNFLKTMLWLVIILTTLGVGFIWWWLYMAWQKTVGMITTYRLVKIVQVNPWNSVTQSLPLGEVVDTSSDMKGLVAAILRLSTFTARSSATSSGVATDDAGKGKARVNKKYFYLENISNSVDLEHYMNKLLHATETHTPEEMKNFRPFVPHLKGEARAKFLEDYPDYWS